MVQVSILIGNTDNKLYQHEWSEFVLETRNHVERFAARVHFFGGPANYERQQNVCWVVDVLEQRLPALKEGLRGIREKFQQDSVALLVSRTEFV